MLILQYEYKHFVEKTVGVVEFSSHVLAVFILPKK